MNTIHITTKLSGADMAAELSRWFGLTLVGDIMVGIVGNSKN